MRLDLLFDDVCHVQIEFIGRCIGRVSDNADDCGTIQDTIRETLSACLFDAIIEVRNRTEWNGAGSA